MRPSEVAFGADAGVLTLACTGSHCRGLDYVEESCNCLSKGQSGDVECVCASAHQYLHVWMRCAVCHCVNDAVNGHIAVPQKGSCHIHLSDLCHNFYIDFISHHMWSHQVLRSSFHWASCITTDTA